MKRVCIIFRGENKRDYIKSVSALNNIHNWRNMIFNDLTLEKYKYDIVFITYNSDILEELKSEINPKEVIINEIEKSSQISNFNHVNQYIKSHIELYDRFIILRFDILYNIKITQWPKWEINSIIVPSKDITWDTSKFYSDIIFIIDKEYYNIFDKAVYYMTNIKEIPPELIYFNNYTLPHHIGQYLFTNNMKLDIMYEGLYDSVNNHPIYTFQRTIS